LKFYDSLESREALALIVTWQITSALQFSPPAPWQAEAGGQWRHEGPRKTGWKEGHSGSGAGRGGHPPWQSC